MGYPCSPFLPHLAISRILLLGALTFPLAADGPGYCWSPEIRKAGSKLALMTLDGSLFKGAMVECTPEVLSLKSELGIRQAIRNEVAVVRLKGPMGDYKTVYAPWSNLSKIAMGEQVRVVFHDLSDHHGVLREVRDDGISILRKGNLEFIERPGIKKVRILVRSNRDAGIKTGSTIGFLLALASMGAAMSGAGGGSFDPSGGAEMLELSGEAGAAAGEAVARMFDEYQTIYVSPARK